MTHRLTCLFAISALAIASTVSAAPFTTISVNFGADDNGVDTSVTDTAGRIDTVNWNNLGGASGSQGNLINGDGAATGASVEWSSPNTWSSTGRGEEANQGTGEDRDLMTGYLDSDDSGTPSATVTFSGLVSAINGFDYDVYVYQQGGVNGRGGDYTIGGDTQTLIGQYDFSDPNVVTFQNEFILGEDYIVFSDVSGDTFTLTAAADADGFRAGINAVEIVARVPEPGTMVLAGLSLIGIGIATRRRK